jgi:mercuric ion binding protein
MNKILIIAIFSFFMKGAFAQDTLYIKTSAVCETCKGIIEKDLSFEKGVKASNLDIESKMLMVVYNPDKTNPDKIRLAVTKSGYDADSLKADRKAFRKLPECCQDPNHKD